MSKTIALLRAAKAAGFIWTLLTSFFLFDVAFSLKTNIVYFALLVFTISLPLFFQGFWSVELQSHVSKKIIILSLFCSFALTQVSLLLYFWPVTVAVGSLFLTAGMYTLLGLGQAHIEARLFKTTVRDYVSLAIFILMLMFFITHWSG